MAKNVAKDYVSAAYQSVHRSEVLRRSRLGPRRVIASSAPLKSTVGEEESGWKKLVRLGAFEVQIAHMHPELGLMVDTLHSKLGKYFIFN